MRTRVRLAGRSTHLALRPSGAACAAGPGEAARRRGRQHSTYKVIIPIGELRHTLDSNFIDICKNQHMLIYTPFEQSLSKNMPVDLA